MKLGNFTFLLVTIWHSMTSSFAIETPLASLEQLTSILKKSDNPAVRPTPRDGNWLKVFHKRESTLKRGGINALLIGDSITNHWSRHPKILKDAFGNRKVCNLGFSGDKTENIIWRLLNHSLGDLDPEVAVVLAGTNNSNGNEYSAEQIAEGVRAIIQILRRKLPDTKIILTGILPRGSTEQMRKANKGLITEAGMNPQWAKIDRVNQILEGAIDDNNTIFHSLREDFTIKNERIFTNYMYDLLHLTKEAYSHWAHVLKPILATHNQQRTDMDMASFKKAAASEWKEVFFDSFTSGWQEQWTLDADVATATCGPDGIELRGGPEFRNDAHHMVLWTKREFTGDIKIEYEFTRLDRNPGGVNILYIQATGSGHPPYEKDISKWAHLRKIPAMSMYFDYMNTYHISYATSSNADKPTDDYIRARRYIPHASGLMGTDLLPDYFSSGLFAADVPHKITVIKRDRDLYMKVTSTEHTKYFHWNNDKLPPIHEGRVGLRLMFTRASLIKNFKVSIPKA